MKNIESNAARLQPLNVIETAISNIRRENGLLKFTEILDFGFQTYEREMPENMENLFSIYLDARSINATTPAALFQLINEGEKLTFDLFDNAAALKAKRSNSLFDLLPDYNAEQLAELVNQANGYMAAENSLSAFQTLQNIAIGTEFRIPNSQTGYTYGMVISSFPNGSTFAITEDGGLVGLFNEAFEPHDIPAKLNTAILEGLEKWNASLSERREHMEAQVGKRAERAEKLAAKAKEQDEKLRAKIDSFVKKYELKMPENFATLQDAWKFAQEAAETAKAAKKEAAATAKAEKEAAKLAADELKAKAKAEKATQPKPEKATKAKGEKKAPVVDPALLANAAANAAATLQTATK